MTKHSILKPLILLSLVSTLAVACSTQNPLPKVDAAPEDDNGSVDDNGQNPTPPNPDDQMDAGETDNTPKEDAPVASGPCGDGNYDHDSNETTACLAWSDCEPGTQVVAEGTATLDRSCNACAPGTFAAEKNAATCKPWTDCLAGDFIAAQGSLTTDQQCMNCPAGKFTASPNSSACVDIGSCAPGTEQTAAASGSTPATCVPCAPGTYCAGGTTPKQTCDEHSWDHDSNAASACVPRTQCAAGQSVATSGSPVSDRTCAVCVTGTFSSAANAATCTAWSDCAPGKFVSDVGTSSTDRKCSDCPAGRFSDASNAISCSAWSNCLEGKFVMSAGTAIADRACEGCASGTFNTAQNATACAAWKSCPAGQFVSNTPSGTADRACVDCQPGTLTTVPNQSSCLPQGACAAGTEQTAAATGTTPAVCTPCAAGNYCAGGTAPKQVCAGDTWDHDANATTACASKTNCGAGTRVLSAGSATADRSCEACTSSFSTTTNAASCTAWEKCDPGEFMNPRGTSQTNTECSPCAGGSFSNIENATACKAWDPCDPGWKVVVGAGGSSTANRQCERCEDGSFSTTQNATTCALWKPCPVGERVTNTPSASVDRNCARCPDGEYTSQPNLQQCTPQGQCAAGTVQTAMGTVTSPPTCEPCLAGTYCAGGIAPKQTCGVGGDTWDHDGNSATPCAAKAVCAAGTRVGNGGSATTPRTCVTCLAGTFSNTQNAASCTDCPPGAYSGTNGATSCTGCAAGTSNASFKATSCGGCATGFFSGANATACTAWKPCNAGFKVINNPSATLDRECAACPTGEYTAQPNLQTCTPQGQCAAGTIQTAMGTPTSPPTCAPCSAGTYCAGGTTPIQTCGVGSNNYDHDSNPATACLGYTPCFAGTRVLSGGTATTPRTCVDCTAGTYSNTQNAMACTLCGPGTANGLSKQVSCPTCVGGYSNTMGATACTPFPPCLEGTKVGDGGTTTTPRTCVDCPAGSYSNTQNAMACTPCGFGTANGLTKQVSCPTCVGGYSNTMGATACTPYTPCSQTCQKQSVAGTTTLDRQCVTSPVIEVSPGRGHTCFRRDNGAVWCTGWNAFGQLGIGNKTDTTTPVNVSGLGNDATRVAAGSEHTCALKANGSLWCWGGNQSGQLGDGTTVDRTTPVQIMTSVSTFYIGPSNTCAKKTDSSFWCWGYNYYGVVGNGNRISPITSPVNVGVIETTAKNVVIGYRTTCVLQQDDRFMCWGDNEYSTLGNSQVTSSLTPMQSLTSVAQGAVGGGHACGRRFDGRVFCWGQNLSGQVGNGATSIRVTSATLVGLGSEVGEVGTGRADSCARKLDGTVWCWGYNNSGQAGDGTTTQRTSPVQVTTLGTSAAAIFVGYDRVCAKKTDGTFWCWGSNISGGLGDGTKISKTTPIQVFATCQ